MSNSKVATVYEIDAQKILSGQTINLNYCKQRAYFSYLEGCEFIFFTGWIKQIEKDQMLEEMKNFGCTESFVTSMKEAIDLGCRWALFYIG